MENIFENFTINILKLNKLVQKIKNYEMREYDLKTIHVMCAYFLYNYPQGLTASELVRLTLEDKAAISRALKTMQDKGFIQYDNNKYNAPIRLTDDGRKLALAIGDKAERAVKAGSADMTDEERIFFYKNLSSIVDQLEEYYCRLINGV